MSWTLFSSRDFELSHLGIHAIEIIQTIVQHSHAPLSLLHMSCFSTVVRTWNDLDAQGDAVEFSHHLMRELNLPGVDFSGSAACKSA